MLGLLTTILGGVSTGGASILAKMLPYVLVGMVAFGGGCWVTYKIDEGSYQALVAKTAEEKAVALAAAIAKQRELDATALEAAQRQNATQTALAAQARRQLSEVQQHVKDLGTRAPYGFVRVLAAAARGVDIDALALPAGKSDDAPSAYSWPALAGPLVADYAACRANGTQLEGLIQVTRDFGKLRPR